MVAGDGCINRKAELNGTPTASTAKSYSKIQIRCDPTNLSPRFLFCGSQYLQAIPWSQAHAYQSSSQPEIIYDLAFREEKQFSEMSDVMIYSPFDMHVPKPTALQVCPSITITPESARKINTAWQDTNSNSIQTKCLENLLEKYTLEEITKCSSYLARAPFPRALWLSDAGVRSGFLAHGAPPSYSRLHGCVWVTPIYCKL